MQGLSLTTPETFPLAPQTPIAWTARASGGTAPLQYKFLLQDVTANTWVIVQDWSSTSTWTWTPTASDFGVWALQVWVRSTGSTAAYEAYVGTGYFVIVP